MKRHVMLPQRGMYCRIITFITDGTNDNDRITQPNLHLM